MNIYKAVKDEIVDCEGNHVLRVIQEGFSFGERCEMAEDFVRAMNYRKQVVDALSDFVDDVQQSESSICHRQSTADD
jgi:hypothetical protein